jgi:radical SAM superfamily enzyme YgiQ (UPF0313 family)
MKVLFVAINSIHEHEDSEFLGYEIMLACLRQHNVDADILHIEYKSTQDDMANYFSKVNLQDVAVLGINCMFPTFKFAQAICQYAKSKWPGIHITIGGALPSVAPVDVLDLLPLTDSVIIGEGEVTICELFDAVVAKQSLSGCNGIVYRENGEIRFTPVRALIRNLNEVPFADRVMLQREKYQFARIQSSRGCEGHCAFCSESRFMKDDTNVHWRGRTPENIVSELEEINQKYKVDSFIFCDSSFEDPITFGKERMREICQEIKKRKLNIHFRVLFRSESVAKMDDDLLEELKDAGLFHVFLGVESGYEPALRFFHKRATVQDNRIAIDRIRRNKLNLTTGFIMFHPYTTEEEILENEKFIIDNKLEFSTYSFVSKMAIHKGSLIYKQAKNDNLLRSHYSICNPFAYSFLNPAIRDMYTRLQSCFAVLNKNKSKELVSLLIFIEDDIRKQEKIVENIAPFYATIQSIREIIGSQQLSLFQYIVHNKEYDEALIENMVAQLCETIEVKRKELNGLHKEWTRVKLKNRIR